MGRSLTARQREHGGWLRHDWWETLRQRLLALWRRGAPRLLRVAVLTLLLISAILGTFTQGNGVAFAAPTPRGPHSSDTPNLFNPATVADHGKVAKTLPGQGKSPAQHGVSGPIQRPSGVTMRPMLLSLAAGAPTYAISSDGRLKVEVPGAAVTTQLVTKAQTQATAEHAHGAQTVVTPNGAPLAVQVIQVEGPSGGGATGNGEVTFGVYLFTLVDTYGQRVSASLAQPAQLSLTLPTGWVGAGFDVASVRFIVNGASLPVNTLQSLHWPKDRFGHYLPLGPRSSMAAKVDLPAHNAVRSTSKTVQPILLHGIILAGAGGTGSSSGTWNTNAPNAYWQKPATSSVDLSTGDLTYSYPLSIPSGPGGLSVPLSLSYSSGNVAGNHNPQSAAGWLGEGWDLSVGSISWSEANMQSACSATCGNLWENTWSFSDPFGNGGELIPPDTNVSIWYDDTTNTPPGVLTAEPLSWLMDTNPFVKVVSYTNPTVNPNFPTSGYPTQPPCFRAFLPNGVMEEFGCTTDSVQYYVNGVGTNFIDQWRLDMVVDASGNQIHFGYTSVTNTDKASGKSFPIDTTLSAITYDSPTCHSTTTLCTTTWHPQVKIVFNTAQTPARLTGSACPTFQNTTTYGSSQTMRCDNVHDLSGSGGLGAPALQSLLILNDVAVQVATNGATPTWETLRDYQFSYEQSASNQNWDDPVTGQLESIAGYLDLTKIQEVGDDNTLTMPPLTMTYQGGDEFYLDNQYMPNPTTDCGPSWNTGQGSGCVLWGKASGRYLSSLSNGEGWEEGYTFTLARNNTHGVDSGLTANNPLACTLATASQQNTSPCNEVDDQNWSRNVITKRQASVKCVRANGGNCGNGGTNNDTLYSTYSYAYFLAGATAHECSGCNWDMYWGNQDDADKLDYYNAHFAGFQTTDVTAPDGSLTVYTFDSTEGYGVATSSISCTSFSGHCDVAPWTDATNVLHGRTTQEQDYDTNGTTLLKETDTTYTVTCPPIGVSASAHNTNPATQYVHERTSEEDAQNPVVVCEVETASATVHQLDGGSSGSSPFTTTTNTYTYDGSGHLAKVSQDVAASNTAATPHLVSTTWYAWHDAISATSTSATGPYLAKLPAIQDTEDGSGAVKACTYIGYDGGTVGADNSVTSLTAGLATESTRYASNCTPGSLSGPISTAQTYNSNGDLLATQDADAIAGISGHVTDQCRFLSINYTACATYDSVYSSQVASVENVANQTTNLGYLDTSSSSTTPDAVNGWGQWLTSMTDANGQKTLYEYDPLGRLSATVKPGDSYGSPTTSYSYPATCAPTGAQIPCIALTTTQRLSGSTTYQSQVYDDGWGNSVETVKPQSVSGTTCVFSVAYTLYDASQRTTFQSDPYFQTVSNDASCTPVYLTPDATQPGTSTLYDGLGRVISVSDALSHTTATTYTPGRPTPGANITDTAIYEATQVVDANSHETRRLSDGLGHTRYVEQMTGTGAPGDYYTLYGTTQSTYDWLGDVTSVTEPNPSGSAGLGTSAQTQTTYNLIKQVTVVVDADRGRMTFAYDPNGNVTTQVDPRLSSGTVYLGYDGLNRLIWRNTTNSPTGAYDSLTYDQTTGHGDGIGHLTSENYTNGGGGSSVSLTGAHAYTYDARGQVTSQTETITGHGFPFGMTYNDAGQQTSLTYSDNEVLTYGYNSYGWLTSLITTPSGQGSTNLLTNITYSGVGGAGGHPTGASVGSGTYTYAAGYDNDGRLTSETLTNTSLGTTLYQSIRGYDNVSNVTSVNTTLTAGTDNQAFCYDALNRLVWAGSTGTPSCGGGISAGTLTAANYTQTMSYDAIGRLTNLSTNGSYTYGDSSHTHAATSIGSVYQATYDAAGDMICRAPGSGITCGGSSPNGQTMTYTNERQLAHWQNTPSSPLTQDDFLYDGIGQRVMQYVNVNGTITTTAYLLGGIEESTGGVITKYLGVSGLPMAVRVGATLSYLASDGLGSVSEAFDTNGNETAAQLYTPYGTVRYAAGSMPTAKGFTGQRADVATGLDYYGARYYDPQAGQFASADSKPDGLSPYAYVKGNPETMTDPTGHTLCRGDGCTGNTESVHFPTDYNHASVGSSANACIGFDHCVVLITGVDISLPKTHSALAALRANWEAWIKALLKKYNGDVGFVLFDAADANSGTDQLHQILAALGSSTFQGTVSVVGHSNGAAALYTYMSENALGHGKDAVINSFVGLDAPTGADLPGWLGSSATAAWSEWTPYSPSWAGVYSYMAKNGSKGAYGFNIMDSVTSPVYGPWPVYVVSGSNPWDQAGYTAHTWLQYNPTPQLLAYA